MKTSKKIIISLAAAALAITPAVATITNTNQVHAVENTNSEQNKQEGLTLNHKTRIYNKKGQKLYSYLRGNALLKKGATIKYTATPKAIGDPSTKRYSFHDDEWNWFYLPYKTIKGKEYYSIGHGGYVKAVNVDKINGNFLYVDEVAATTQKSFSSSSKINLYDEHGKQLNKYLKTGQKVIIDRRVNIDDFDEMKDYGNGGDYFYRIKGKNEFISFRNVKLKLRQTLQSFSDYTLVYAMRDTKVYKSTGVTEKTIYYKGETLTLAKNMKMIDLGKNKIELFYRVSGMIDGYIKASDVKYISGPKLENIK